MIRNQAAHPEVGRPSRCSFSSRLPGGHRISVGLHVVLRQPAFDHVHAARTDTLLLPITWVNERNQALLVRNALQESGKLPLLFFGKPRQQCLLVIARNTADSLQSGLACFRQVQSIAAPVALMRPSFQQPLGFEFIHKRHQPARKRPKSRCQRLLGDRRCRPQNSEDAGMSGNQLQFHQTLGKLRGRMRPYLRQQERSPGTRLRL